MMAWCASTFCHPNSGCVDPDLPLAAAKIWCMNATAFITAWCPAKCSSANSENRNADK
ncbi:hypothetical protein ACLK17_08825 [Escherichia coli]